MTITEIQQVLDFTSSSAQTAMTSSQSQSLAPHRGHSSSLVADAIELLEAVARRNQESHDSDGGGMEQEGAGAALSQTQVLDRFINLFGQDAWEQRGAGRGSGGGRANLRGGDRDLSSSALSHGTAPLRDAASAASAASVSEQDGACMDQLPLDELGERLRRYRSDSLNSSSTISLDRLEAHEMMQLMGEDGEDGEDADANSSLASALKMLKQVDKIFDHLSLFWANT
jgi:hypothetical protein